MPPSFRPLIDLAETLQRQIAAGPVATTAEAARVRRHLANVFDFDQPMELPRLASKVTEMLDRWQVQVTHPRYFGLFNPSVTTASVVADTLVAAYNPQLAAWSHSPAANEIERFTLAAVAARLGLEGADGEVEAGAHFTSGGAEANLTGLVCALAHHFPAWARDGVRAIDGEPRLYISGEGHHSVHKAARVAGLGQRAVVVVATDAGGRMDAGALAERIAADRAAGHRPFLVVATAGTTGGGAIDPLAVIADLCVAQGLWLHIDAAWGGAAALSPRLRPHLAGIERADSLTFDAHKWLSVPMGAGMFFCRHRHLLAAAFGQDTPYMPASSGDEVADPFSHSLQWSRRFIGLKLFMTLAEAGWPAVIARIEQQTALGDYLRQRLRAGGWTIANDTPLPVVCFGRANADAGELVRQLHHRQIAWMSPIRIAGGPLLVRACITGQDTTAADVDAVVAQLSELA